MSSELVLRKKLCGSSESRLEAEGRVRGLRVNTRAEGECGDCEPILFSGVVLCIIIGFFPEGKKVNRTAHKTCDFQISVCISKSRRSQNNSVSAIDSCFSNSIAKYSEFTEFEIKLIKIF